MRGEANPDARPSPPAPRSGRWRAAVEAGLVLGLAVGLARAVLIVARHAGSDPVVELRASTLLVAAGDALPVALVACAVGAALRLFAGRRSIARGAAALAAGVLATLAAAHRLPASPLYAPAGGTTRSLLAWAGAVSVGLAAALLVAGLVPRRVLRPAAGLAALTLLGAALAAHLAAPAPASWPERPNLILISLDTLRADHLSCYGHERPTTPELDAFAREATRFTRAYTTDGWTLTAHMSMLTGLAPGVHGVDEDRALPASVPTLAEQLAAAGYSTFAVVDSCPWISPRYGFARGFDLYRTLRQGARTKVEQALDLLDHRPPGPFFLFAHFFDAHSDHERLPYEADAQDAARFAGWYQGAFDGCLELGGEPPREVCASKLLSAINAGELVLAGPEQRLLADLYDAGIRSLDRQLGRLLEGMRSRGLLEDSVVVITADHGELLFERGAVLHGVHVEEVLHVPLLVRTPEARPALQEALVSLVDLAPTLLAFAGREPAAPVQGAALLELLSGEVPATWREHLTTDSGGQVRFVRAGPWSLRRSSPGWELEREGTPVAPEDAPAGLVERIERIAGEAEAALAAGRERRGEGAKLPSLGDAERRQLEALGYAGDE